MVKVIGRLGYAGEPLQAPLSKRTRACYEVIVTHPGQGENDDVQVIHDWAHTDFLLNDGTGTALVRMGNASRTSTRMRRREALGSPTNTPAPAGERRAPASSCER